MTDPKDLAYHPVKLEVITQIICGAGHVVRFSDGETAIAADGYLRPDPVALFEVAEALAETALATVSWKLAIEILAPELGGALMALHRLEGALANYRALTKKESDE